MGSYEKRFKQLPDPRWIYPLALILKIINALVSSKHQAIIWVNNAMFR